MKLSSITTIAFLLLAAAGIVRAQDKEARKHQGETGEPSIITRDYVQDECKLSDEQKQKLSKTSPGFKPILDSQDNEKIWAFIKETMNAEQFRRFGQLEVQHDGPPALFRPKITQELKITDEQRQQFMGFVQEMTQQVQPLIQESKSAATPEKMEEFRLKVIKLRLDCLGKMVARMSAAQKKQWEEMIGKPFDTLRHH